MNTKEIAEIRRRITVKRSNMNELYCCYVNSSKEVLEEFELSVSLMNESEKEMYFNLMKKVLSGTPGRNLLDINFSTKQVMESDRHKLLMTLRNSRLKDAEARGTFFRLITESVDLESNYIILLGCDSYDVPKKGADGADFAEGADEVYHYLVCAICPVKDGKAELGYAPTDKVFRCMNSSQRVAGTEFGFLFPAFDDRAANIYNALFYSRSTGTVHQEFIDAVFSTDPLMPADDQEKAFNEVLAESVQESCSFELVKAVHSEVRARVMKHKESKDPEMLSVTPEDMGDLLQECGVSQEEAEAFEEKCLEQFGSKTVLSPANLVNVKKFSVVTPHIKISVEPDFSYLVETRVIDGKKYLLIPAGEGVEVNGLDVKVKKD
ncbi:MAG: DUF4317 domain-containing protein [Oscillospiraceae bacterium]|nr:DUF4317 domain-containing protein [Oscillospiraceae bacterium]